VVIVLILLVYKKIGFLGNGIKSADFI